MQHFEISNFEIESINDFDRFLVEYEFTKDFVRAVSEHEADQVPMPKEFDKLRLQASNIQDTLFNFKLNFADFYYPLDSGIA